MPNPKTNETLEFSDLVKPLSLEAIMYFVADDLPKPEGRAPGSARSGKFIRIGEAMLMGTTLEYGDPRNLRYLKHHQLRDLLMMDEDLASIAEATGDSEPRIKGGLTDAGSTFIMLGKSGVRRTSSITLRLGSDSFDFGRADEAGRQRSIEIAQELVGETIKVVESPY